MRLDLRFSDGEWTWRGYNKKARWVASRVVKQFCDSKPNSSYHYGHILSVKNCFVLRVNPLICSCPLNLELVKAIDNLKNSTGRNWNVGKLLSEYRQWEYENQEWAEVLR